MNVRITTLASFACLSLLAAQQPAPKVPKGPPPPALQPASVMTTPGMPPAEPGAMTIVVLPDTQFYSQLHPEIFHQQTQWVADNIKHYDIRFLLQLGDITETAADAEWQVARDAFARISGKVPFSLAPGNHDYGGRLQTQTHRTHMSEFFPVSQFQAMPTFAGVYDAQPDKPDNQCHTFEAGGRKWLVIALEFAPRSDVLRWAGDVVARHPDHSAIIITHAYLDPRTNLRFQSVPAAKDPAAATQPPPPDLNQGEDIWKKLASKHSNIAIVLSGHACYTNRRTDTGVAGNIVHEMVVDYQRDVNGGNGWLRLLQILPDGKTIRSREYSPKLDLTCTMPDRTFDFEIGKAAP